MLLKIFIYLFYMLNIIYMSKCTFMYYSLTYAVLVIMMMINYIYVYTVWPKSVLCVLVMVSKVLISVYALSVAMMYFIWIVLQKSVMWISLDCSQSSHFLQSLKS